MSKAQGPILAITDFSPNAGRAARRAAQLALRHRCGLELMHVARSLGSTPWWAQPARTDGDDDPSIAHAREQLASQAKELSGRFGIEVGTRLERGSVAGQVHQRAGQADARLVVIGATGHGALARRLLGSTTQAVLQGSPCNVLVVRRPVDGDYTRVLFATDFSPQSEEAIHAGLALAPGAATVFFTALDLTRSDSLLAYGLSEHERADKLQEARTAVRDRLGTLAARVGHDGAGIVVRDGRAADMLPAAIEENQAQLLALGAHGRSGLERMVLGSTTLHAAAEAPCDVLVVPAGGDAD